MMAGLWWYLTANISVEIANAKTLEFITGYLIEKSLAVDNVFVWLMIFSYFAIPPELQKRVLILGVLGAIVLRAIMIFAGIWLINQFHWLFYLFGAFLLFTGIKMWWAAEQESDIGNNALVLWLRRHCRISERLAGEKFFVSQLRNNKMVLYATPLFLVLD